MWSDTISISQLTERDRWRVEFFCEAQGEVPLKGAAFRTIRQLAHERKESVDPQTRGSSLVRFIGLENIAPVSGELIGHTLQPASNIRSRSKLFMPGDVLYGRLRPNLNKVWLADDCDVPGICSTEFVVLVPRLGVVKPIVLRYLLSTFYVVQQSTRMVTGTALPRVNVSDLLDIGVPVPPLDVQQDLAASLERDFEEYCALRQKVDGMPNKILETFLSRVEDANRV